MNKSDDMWSAVAVQQNRQWLTAYILAMTGDLSECDDMVQETFKIAYERMKSFEPGTNFGAWLRAIARNVCLRHCAMRKRVPLISQEAAEARLEQLAAESAERMIDPSREERRKEFLAECIERLGGYAKRLIILRYGRGMSMREIAREVGRGVSAVTVAIFRAREALSECIRRKEAGLETGAKVS